MTEAIVTDWRDALRAHGACKDGIQWAAGYDSFQAAWDACARGDWMLWWIGHTLKSAPMSAARRPVVRIACQCARLALPYVKAGETRPLAAIELAERWANGDDSVTREQMRAADDAAYAAVAAAADAAAADAAYAAADAVVASVASASVAVAAADDAAYAASAAAGYAAADAGYDRTNVLAQCAAFVRAEYPHPPSSPLGQER